jgi:hypothetical protein
MTTTTRRRLPHGSGSVAADAAMAFPTALPARVVAARVRSHSIGFA